MNLEKSAFSLAQLSNNEDNARTKITDRDPQVWPNDCYYVPTDTLSLKNKFVPQDDQIKFIESTHEYFIKGKKAPISVTSLVHAPFKHFDPKSYLESLTPEKRKEKFGTSDIKTQMKKWNQYGKEMADLGTKMHAALEIYCNTGIWTQDQQMMIEMQHARNFMKHEIEDKNLEFYRTEPIVFIDQPGQTSEEPGIMIAGSVDLVCKHKHKNEYYIFDWKRSKEIKTNSYGKFGTFAPFTDIPDAPHNGHYPLQLHVYRYILSHFYHLNIPKENLYLVVINPVFQDYKVIQCPDYSEQVEWFFKSTANFQKCVELHQHHQQRLKELEEFVKDD